jgi:hypothetical protein
LQKGLGALCNNSEGEIPELHDSNGHIEAEEVEAFLVAVSDTGLRPYAVMVHFVLALVAAAAM